MDPGAMDGTEVALFEEQGKSSSAERHLCDRQAHPGDESVSYRADIQKETER